MIINNHTCIEYSNDIAMFNCNIFNEIFWNIVEHRRFRDDFENIFEYYRRNVPFLRIFEIFQNNIVDLFVINDFWNISDDSQWNVVIY